MGWQDTFDLAHRQTSRMVAGHWSQMIDGQPSVFITNHLRDFSLLLKNTVANYSHPLILIGLIYFSIPIGVPCVQRQGFARLCRMYL